MGPHFHYVLQELKSQLVAAGLLAARSLAVAAVPCCDMPLQRARTAT